MNDIANILRDITNNQISGDLDNTSISEYIPVLNEYFDGVVNLSNEQTGALIGYKYPTKCVKRLNNVNNDISDIANLIKYTYTNKLEVIVFVCHLDVVTGDNSIMQYNRQGDKIYVRGAVDMKGAIASALHAINQADLYEYPILMCLNGDEETDGIAALITSEYIRNNFSVKFIIGTEPTSINHVADNIKTSRLSSMTCSVHAYASTQHVAYTDYNPANDLCIRFTQLAQQFNICNIIDFSTKYVASNCTPENASITFNIRSHYSYDELVHKIDNIFDAVHIKSFRSGFKSTINAQSIHNIQSKIAILAGCNVDNINSGGTSDLYAFTDLAPYIELGLLHSSAHEQDEHVHIAELEILSNIYLCIIENIDTLIQQ